MVFYLKHFVCFWYGKRRVSIPLRCDVVLLRRLGGASKFTRNVSFNLAYWVDCGAVGDERCPRLNCPGCC